MDGLINTTPLIASYRQINLWLTVFFLALFLLPVTANAAAILSADDAAVTAFSGMLTKNNEVMIDVNGPSVRIIKLPTSGPFGLRDANKSFTVQALEVGQVFGIALDNKSAPNIFVAASSAYGVGLIKPNNGRIKKGEAGAEYMPGQVGAADQKGGPNSIWRIDGSTGESHLICQCQLQRFTWITRSTRWFSF